MTELVVRMAMSLCVVLGLLLLAARIAGKRYRANTGSTIKVLQRQALTRGSTVTVVSVGNRVLVLGTTEQQVRVLTELDPAEITAADDAPIDGAPGRLYAVPTAAGVHASPTSAVAPDEPQPSVTTDFAQVLLEAQDHPGTPPAPGVDAPGRHAARHRAAQPRAAQPTQSGALAGSLLSPQTWRQALQALSGRAS